MSGDTVCVVPARAGSKRLPGKNLASLGGKPLIRHTIDAAVESGVFAEVVVSSDDDGVLDLARSLGISADRRPDALATDTARAVEVVAELLDRRWRSAPRRVAMMLPTCPLRTADDVRAAVCAFDAEPDVAFLVGVTAFEFPPELALYEVGGGPRVRMADPGAYRTSTRGQSWPRAVRPNGSIYLADTVAFLRERTFFVDPCLVHVMPAERSIDIDFAFQLQMAEALLMQRAEPS